MFWFYHIPAFCFATFSIFIFHGILIQHFLIISRHRAAGENDIWYPVHPFLADLVPGFGREDRVWRTVEQALRIGEVGQDNAPDGIPCSGLHRGR